MPSVAHAEVWQGIVQGPTTWTFTFVLAVVLPILDFLLYARLKSTLRIYAWNILAEWSLVAACVWAIRSRLGLADLGEQLGNPWRTLVVSGVLVAVIAALTVFSKNQKRKVSPAQWSKAADKVRRMLPVSQTERRLFVAVALTAGVCEEFLYRGWLLNLLGTVLGSVWVGLVVSSILFGVAHAYQGGSGMIGACLLGFVFGILLILSGSLLPGQVLHTVIDLTNGLSLGKVAA